MKGKLITRIISTLLSAIVVTSVATVNTNLVSAVEDAKESKYLVLTENDSALNKAEELSSKSENVFSTDNTNVSKFYLSKSDVNTLKNTTGVIAVEKDVTVLGSTNDSNEEVDVTDYLFKDVNTDDLNLWYLDAIGSNNVDNGDKIKIEILDSGVNYSSDIDIKDRVNLIEGNDFSPLYEDFSGHGTSMASVIGAIDNGKGVTGINPNAELYSVKVLDDNIQAPISRIVEGIQWGIDHKMNIINMSFGTNINSTVLREVVQKANKAGILLVSATGNNSNDIVQYPAAYPEVLAVGSMNEKSEISDFTSVGEELDVVAPGEKIETAGIFGTINGTSGTSISTAEVSAVASKILEIDNTKSPDFVKGLILASAKKIKDENVDTGAVDCNCALEMYNDYEKSYTPNNNSYKYVNPDETTTYNTDGFVTGLWSGTKHAEMAASSSEWLASTEGLKLIKAGARCADFPYVDGENFKEISVLHGTGNYVATLKCAWMFVATLGNGSSISKAYDKSSDHALDLSKYGETDSNVNKIIEMLDEFELLDAIDFRNIKDNNGNKVDYKIQGDNSSKKAVLYKALGLCFHIVGDVFAHRTQIPKSYADKAEFHVQRYFPKYFPNKSNALFTKDVVKNLIKEVQTHNSVPSAHRYYEYLNFSIENEFAEFRDIKRFCPGYYNNTTIKKEVLNQYEDNPNFFTKRYDEACDACDYLMTGINESGSGYKYDVILDYLIFVPNSSYDGKVFRLSSLKGNMEKAGYSTNGIPDSQWDLCTCYPKKVDDNGKVVKNTN